MLLESFDSFFRCFVVKGDAHRKARCFEDGTVGREQEESTAYEVFPWEEDDGGLSGDIRCFPDVTEDVFLIYLLVHLCGQDEWSQSFGWADSISAK